MDSPATEIEILEKRLSTKSQIFKGCCIGLFSAVVFGTFYSWSVWNGWRMAIMMGIPFGLFCSIFPIALGAHVDTMRLAQLKNDEKFKWINYFSPSPTLYTVLISFIGGIVLWYLATWCLMTETWRGYVYLTAGQNKNAVAVCTKAISLDPLDWYAYVFRANAYENLRQYDKAVADYSKAITVISPKSETSIATKLTGFPLTANAKLAYTYGHRGCTYAQLDQRKEALDDCNKCIELDPNIPVAYSYRANAYTRQGNYQKSIDDYTKIISLNPKLAWPYAYRGYGYGRLGLYQQEIDDCNKAIIVDPKFALAYGYRGFAYLQIGQYQKVIDDCTQALDLDPKNSNIYYGRGQAFDKLGQYQKAIDDYNQAVKLAPEQGVTYFYRALTYDKIGKHDLAALDKAKANELGYKSESK